MGDQDRSPMYQRFDRPPSLPEEIARRITADIRDGRLPPGSQLPTEAELARSFEVSRTVIREAVSRLKYDGLVRSHQGLGAFVCEEPARAPLRIEPVGPGDQQALVHLFELLVVVESGAAALAAARREEAQLAAIRAALDEMATAVTVGLDGVDADAKFHGAIADATNNSYFRALGAFLDAHHHEGIRAARQNTARYHRPEVVQAEHERIYEAIAAGDPAAAADAMRTHLTNAIDRLQLRPTDTAVPPAAE